jgi:hypothetical protein
MAIIFKEDTHQYFNTDNNKEYLSGTKFLHLFEPTFDKYGISKRVAEKEGKTQQEVLDEWAATSKAACEMGTATHLIMENYIKFGEKEDEHKILYDTFHDCVGKDFKYAEAIHSEMLLWNHEYEIAGQADLIIDHKNNEFSIGDFKTNKKIEFCSAFGNRMLQPVAHLSQCQHNIYALQLSLYAYMYSLLTGRKLRHIFLMHCNDRSKGWKYIPCNAMEHEIRFMLHFYKEHIKNKN